MVSLVRPRLIFQTESVFQVLLLFQDLLQILIISWLAVIDWVCSVCLSACVYVMCFAKWIKLVSGVMIATEVNYFVLDKTADPSSERETSRLWIFTGRFLACGVIYYKWKCVCVCVCVCVCACYIYAVCTIVFTLRHDQLELASKVCYTTISHSEQLLTTCICSVPCCFASYTSLNCYSVTVL